MPTPSLPTLVLALFTSWAGVAPARAASDEVLVYPGFGSQQGAVLEGRVQVQRSSHRPVADDSALKNLGRNVRLFKNEEREGVPVVVRVGGHEWNSVTDDEGYFRVTTGTLADLVTGWSRIEARTLQGQGVGQLLVLPPDNQLGLISDIDDTILVTEVNDKAHMLANTFLKNPAQREAVPAMAWLYAKVLALNPNPQAAPLFYLSASPTQLQASISRFLSLNAFPAGVLITKRVSNDRSSEPLLDQMAYKTRKIEDILARTPGVKFVLVGDDGERDPDIYEAVRTRHPDRILAIWIRRVHPHPGSRRIAGQRDVSDVLRETAKHLGQ